MTRQLGCVAAFVAAFAAALAACSMPPGSTHAAAAAARADSSAAGYAASPAAAGRAAPIVVMATAEHAHAHAASPPRPPVAATSSAPAPSAAEPARGATRTDTATAADSAPHDTTPPSGPIVAGTSTLIPVPTGRTRVNDFLSYDAGLRTAFVRLVAGYTGFNGALNINGGARGSQRIVVPVGWRVDVAFVNRDGDLPHSAIVIAVPERMPLDPPPAAFAGASTDRPADGFTEGGADTFSFVADVAGRFAIVCAVPGHAQGGQWIRLDVVANEAAPGYH